MNAATILAVASGNTNDPSKWNLGRIPISTDIVDIAGYSMIQAGGPLVFAGLKNSGTASATLTITDDFTCPEVLNTLLTCNAEANISFGTSGVSPGLVLNTATTFYALALLSGSLATVSGDMSVSGSNTAIAQSHGTLVDFTGVMTLADAAIGVDQDASLDNTIINFSGSIINPGESTAMHIIGPFGSFSGTINNSGGSVGMFLDGVNAILEEFSGTIIHSGAVYGVFNDMSTIRRFSGTVENLGEGSGINNMEGTIEVFSGLLTNSGAGIGIDNTQGTIGTISGTVNNTGYGTGILNPAGSLNSIGRIVGSVTGDYGIPYSGLFPLITRSDIIGTGLL